MAGGGPGSRQWKSLRSVLPEQLCQKRRRRLSHFPCEQPAGTCRWSKFLRRGQGSLKGGLFSGREEHGGSSGSGLPLATAPQGTELFSSPKNKWQGRGLRSSVMGRAWLDTFLPLDTAPPGRRAAELPSPAALAGPERSRGSSRNSWSCSFPEGPAGLSATSCRAQGGPQPSPGARLRAWESCAPAQTNMAGGVSQASGMHSPGSSTVSQPRPS